MKLHASTDRLDYSRLPNDLTPLYALPVIAAESATTQALSSYVSILALKHRLSLKTLLKFIGDYCTANNVVSHSVKYIEDSRLDSGADYSAYLVSAIQMMTGISVAGCCWLKLRNVFAGNFHGVVRPTRQWCVSCYREQREKFRSVYEPLIWSFPSATICPHHCALYEEICPGCGQLQPLMSSETNHWFCTYCKSELAGQTVKPRLQINRESVDWNIWLHHELGRLIMGLWDGAFTPDNMRFRTFVKILARNDARGYRGLSKQTGVLENTLSEWVRKGPPRFTGFLRFCASLGVSPLSVLSSPVDAVNEIGAWPIKLLSEPRQKRLNLGTTDWTKINKQVQEILSSDKAIPPIREVCRMLGVSEGTLRSGKPELIRLLETKRRRQRRIASDLAKRKLYFLGVKIFEEMHAAERRLNRRTFERELIWRSGCGYKSARAIYSILYQNQ